MESLLPLVRTTLFCLLVLGTSTEAANIESSITQTCARELHTVAPNCVTSMFSDVQTLKVEIANVKNADELLKNDLDAERKTVSELRKEVGKKIYQLFEPSHE